MTGTDLPTEMAMASESRKSDKTRASIENNYREELEGLLEDVDELVDDDDQANLFSALSTRTEQVNLLRDLIRRKASLEAEILKHTGELSIAYFTAQKEMNAAIANRMQSINDAMHELQGAAEEGGDDAKLAVDGATDGQKGEKRKTNKRKREIGEAKATRAHQWITDVPTHEQVLRAMAMAEQGKRI